MGVHPVAGADIIRRLNCTAGTAAAHAHITWMVHGGQEDGRGHGKFSVQKKERESVLKLYYNCSFSTVA